MILVPKALVAGLPNSAAHTFRCDRRSELASGAFLAGLFMAADVVAPQFFGAGYLALALIASGQFLGSLWSSAVGARADAGGTVRMVAWNEGVSRMGLVLLPLVALAGALIGAEAALAVLVFLVAVGFFCQMIPVPARIRIYHANYPEAVRGRLFGLNRQARQGLAVLVTAALCVSWAPGLWSGLLGTTNALLPRASVYVVLPILGLIGLWGTWQFTRIRVAGDADPREALADVTRKSPAWLGPGGAILSAGAVLVSGARGVLAVLRQDRRFALYMALFSIFGFGNLMLRPVLPVYFADAEGINASVLEQGLLMIVIPQTMVFLLLGLTGRVFDRVHMLVMRAVSCLVLAAVPAILLMSTDRGGLFVAMAVRGVGTSAGMVLWSLSVLYFAPPDRVAAYMGVHVFLTGVRGVIAPHVGGWLASEFGVRTVFAVSTAMLALPAAGLMAYAWHDLKRGHWGVGTAAAHRPAEAARDSAPA